MALQRNDALLVVIDVQEKLAPVINGIEALTRNIDRLIRGCRVLDVPVIVTEQYVQGLGRTIEPLRRALDETAASLPIEKASFSAFANGEFQAEIRRIRKQHVILCGIETHVCVYQTAMDFLAAGRDVTIVADAVSSRTADNRELALRRLSAEGAKLASTEMVLFEMLAVSGTEEFRAISKLVK